MSENYLPKVASIQEACEWLKIETGQTFCISRLLESGLMPWFWLEYNEKIPDLFDGKIEGYLAPIVFNGDVQRLSQDKGDALVNFISTPNGEYLKVAPPIRVISSDLRFKRDELNELALTLKTANSNSNQTSPKPLSRQSFQEQEILRVIKELGFDPKSIPKWRAGKPGLKAAVREKLNFTVNIFEAAWERLRGYKDIQDEH